MNNVLEKFKKDLDLYLKKKEEIFSDLMRLDGIIMYINAEISRIAKENIDNK